jgi:hypothetical protein
MQRQVLLRALALGALLLSGSRLPAPPLPPATGSAGHSVERHLLDDTDLLVVVNVKEIAKSAFFTKHVKADLEKLLGRDEIKPFLKDAGIDPLKDVDQILVCMGKSCFADAPGGQGEDGPVLVLQGTFDKARIDRQLAKLAEGGRGVKAVEHNKAKFHRLGGDGGPYVAALDKTALLICGSKAQVTEQLGRVAGKSKVKLKYPAIAAFLKERAKSPAAVDAVALESMVVGLAANRGPAPGGGAGAKREHLALGDVGFKQFTVQVKVKDDARGALRMDVKKAAELDTKVKQGQEIVAKMKQGLNNVPPGAGVTADQVAKMKEFVNGIKVKGDKGAVVYEATGTGGQAAAVLRLIAGRLDRP